MENNVISFEFDDFERRCIVTKRITIIQQI